MRKKIHTIAKSLIKAYTLAEVLITLVIVAIIAVVLAPLANKMRPDSKKVTYLKSYDALVNAVQKAAKNSALYSPYYKPYNNNPDNKVFNVSHYPLINISQPQKGPFADPKYSGDYKLAYVLDDLLGGRNTGTGFDGENVNFFTSNGVEWLIGKTATTIESSNVTFEGNVTIDIDGRAGKGCVYNATTCPKPDRFTFVITPSGEVLASDKYGQAYLDTRREFFRKEVEPKDPPAPTISISMDEIEITDEDEIAEAESVTVTNPNDCEHNQSLCERVIKDPCEGVDTKECNANWCDKHFDEDKSYCCNLNDPSGSTDRCACVVSPSGTKCKELQCENDKVWHEDKCCPLDKYKGDVRCKHGTSSGSPQNTNNNTNTNGNKNTNNNTNTNYNRDNSPNNAPNSVYGSFYGTWLDDIDWGGLDSSNEMFLGRKHCPNLDQYVDVYYGPKGMSLPCMNTYAYFYPGDIKSGYPKCYYNVCLSTASYDIEGITEYNSSLIYCVDTSSNGGEVLNQTQGESIFWHNNITTLQRGVEYEYVYVNNPATTSRCICY